MVNVIADDDINGHGVALGLLEYAGTCLMEQTF